MLSKTVLILKNNKKKLFLAVFIVAAMTFAMVRSAYYVDARVDAYFDKNNGGLDGYLDSLIDKSTDSKELDIGFVTDIHAGSLPTKEKGSGTITPDNFEKNLALAFKNINDADYVIALGDNIDQRQDCQTYADRLKEITKGYNMIWVKGNHDKDACFPYLSSKPAYYYIDDGTWRIIIVNNSYWYSKDQRNHGKDNIGFIEQPQLDWLKNALDTDKKVLVAMHVPMFNDNGDGKEFTLRKDYVDFKKMLEKNGNVRYVFSGHYHNDNWHLEENGINYYILPSLEQQGHEGYSMVLKLTK
jgi:hypothetical protein